MIISSQNGIHWTVGATGRITRRVIPGTIVRAHGKEYVLLTEWAWAPMADLEILQPPGQFVLDEPDGIYHKQGAYFIRKQGVLYNGLIACPNYEGLEYLGPYTRGKSLICLPVTPGDAVVAPSGWYVVQAVYSDHIVVHDNYHLTWWIVPPRTGLVEIDRQILNVSQIKYCINTAYTLE